MALAHLVLGLPLQCRRILRRGGAAEERWRAWALSGAASLACSTSGGKVAQENVYENRSRSGTTEITGHAKLKMSAASLVETGQIRSGVEIPVTCYQLLGVTVKAEKDEIVKAVNVLKSSETEDGYTADTIISRQDLLEDLRDKLLFEPEYAGNLKENFPPKSSLRLPWAWLPAALCLLQEVGEEDLVLDIGRAAVQIPESKLYIHDLLLSMALAECSIAKEAFEKNKISKGFEALARAQHLLRSKNSLEKMPLLSEIEESLEELAPACTVELLGLPQTPDSIERRRGAIAALRELIGQGLSAESSSRVRDWPCFLIQAMRKLTATEIVDLLSWDDLAIIRKNKKSLESQNQRVVLDFDCFYLAMVAHIALGFSSRQTEMISKAKAMCECLTTSEGVDLKFEEAFCSFLLGQGVGVEAVEKLRQLQVNTSSSSRNMDSSKSGQEKDKDTMNRALETWLKDCVLCLFSDTQECSPSLANYFGSPKRILSSGKRMLETTNMSASIGQRTSRIAASPDCRVSGAQAGHINSTRHLGEAVKQLAPADLQRQSTINKITGAAIPPLQLNRNLDLQNPSALGNWSSTQDSVGKFVYTALLGCVLLGTFKTISMCISHSKISHRLFSRQSSMKTDTHRWTWDRPFSFHRPPTSISTKLQFHLAKLLKGSQLKQTINERVLQNSWPDDEVSSIVSAKGVILQKRQMAFEEAEDLVKQWEDIKAEALGPSYHLQALSDILAEPMLSKWRDLANSARARSCFWRFVLLKLSILRAEIISHEAEREIAEVEVILEEAAELVDESKPKKPSYYSTYKVLYILERQKDGSWRFCECGIQNLV